MRPVSDVNNWLVPLLTFLGTVFAGTGLKWLEGWLRKNKDKDDTATNLRNELRLELVAMKADIQKTEDELDEWKAKYYEVIERLITMKAQLEDARKILEAKGLELPQPPPLAVDVKAVPVKDLTPPS